MTDEPRTYRGRYALPLIIGAVVVVAVGLNLVAKAHRDTEPRAPRPSVTTLAP